MNAAWTYLLSFVFGASGTLCRIAISPTIEFGANRRTIVEGIAGGVSGLLLPYFGTILAALLGVTPEQVAAMPTVIKGGICFVLNYSGSFSIGEVITRVRNGRNGNA